MSLTKGGGSAKKSTLSKEQMKALEEFLPKLIQGISQGAAPLEGSLFSPEEEQAFAAMTEALGSFQARSDAMGLTDALKSQLSGDPSSDINEKATLDYFEKSISAPLRKAFARDIVPEIQRGFGGFTSARGKAIGQAYEGLTGTLAAEFGKLQLAQEARRQELAEAAATRQAGAIGMTESVLAQPEASAARFGTVAEARQGRRMQEEARTRLENNPFFEQALALLGTPMTRIVDRPAGLTGFGQVLTGMQAVGTTINSFGSSPTSKTSSGATSGAGVYGGGSYGGYSFT